MTPWAEFVEQAGELGEVAVERILGPGLALLGTLRRDGGPRISPIEVRVDGPHLQLGMMWQSPKALDLGRDPRCVLHSLVTDKDGSEGDMKITARAAAVTDAEDLERYGRNLFEATGWRPEGDFHLFVIDVLEAGYVRFADGRELVRVWQPGTTGRQWDKAGA